MTLPEATGKAAAPAIDQPTGPPLPGWTARPFPGNALLAGRTVRILPLSANDHAAPLWEAFGGAANPQLWTYIPDGPFADFAAFSAWLRTVDERPDWVSFAIEPPGRGAPAGIASYMRIDAPNGAAEIGCIVLGEGLARTAAATEAMALLAARIFDELGYRRYEWKCDSLNAPSRRAALRLGFRFEGIFRQHLVIKGRNRDTAWFSITDGEWPALQARFARWLDPVNFDAAGRQLQPLSAF